MSHLISDKGRKKAISMALNRPFEKTIAFLNSDFSNAAIRCVDIEEIDPRTLSPSSPLKVEWKCKCGNLSVFKVIDIFSKRKSILCYQCNLENTKLQKMEKGLPEKNTLEFNLPLIAKQFVRFIDYPSLSVKSVSMSSTYEIEWRCTCQKIFVLKPINKHLSELNSTEVLLCPECIYKNKQKNNFGRANINGAVFLKDESPELYKKLIKLADSNELLALEKIGPKSRKIAIWECDCGLKFSRQISTVYNRGQAVCNVCSRRGESLFELEMKELLETSLGLKVDLQHSRNKLPKVDLYIPEKDIAIQLDPYFFHKGREERDQLINEKHLTVYKTVVRMREKGLKQFNNSVSVDVDVKYLDVWFTKTVSSLNLPYKKLTEEEFSNALGKANLLWNKSRTALEENFTQSKYFIYYVKNLTHPERNPEFLPLYSGDRLLLICENKHEWIVSPNALHRKGRSAVCPNCRKSNKAQ
jgi:hypothetical protein